MPTPFHLAQLDFIVALQKSAFLASFLKLVTLLGNEEFFLLLIPLTYICINRRIGLQLGILVLASDALNVLLKVACTQPRPYWIDGRIVKYAVDPSFGLPSSHAQNAVVVWFFLAWCWRQKHPHSPVFLAAAALVFLISLSRVFLGVHFPTDILGGWLLGALVLGAFFKFEPALATRFRQPGAGGLLALAVAGPIVLLLVTGLMSSAIATFGNEFAKMGASVGLEAMAGRTGALCGLGIGLVLAARNARFTVSGAFFQRAVNFIIVFIGVLVFWRGLAVVFPKHPETVGLAFRFLRYALLTCWVAYWAPLLLLKMKRLSRDTETLATA